MSPTCWKGNEISETAQIILAGDLSPERKVRVSNNFHRVYTVTPVHIPEVKTACKDPSDTACVIEVQTVTENL